jgi:hypothetical protein
MKVLFLKTKYARFPVARDYTTRDFVLSVLAHSLINSVNYDYEKKIKIHSIICILFFDYREIII